MTTTSSTSSPLPVSPSPANTMTADYLKQHTSIGGFLSFILVAIGVGGLISLIYPLITYQELYSSYGSHAIALVDVVLGASFFGLAVYSIYAFCNRLPNAVFLVKTYYLLSIFISILAFFDGDMSDSDSKVQAISRIAGGLVCFLYICFSSRVEEVIPVPYRKTSTSDYLLLAAIIGFPLLLTIYGSYQVVAGSREYEAPPVNECTVSDGEVSTGKIICALVDGYSLFKETADDGTVWLNFKADNGSIQVFCYNELDRSDDTISEYWKNIRRYFVDSNYKENPYPDERRSVNGHDTLFKQSSFISGDRLVPVSFAFVPDETSSKVCIVVGYNADATKFEKTVYSVRFK